MEYSKGRGEMKLFLIVSMVVLFAACSGSSEQNEAESASSGTYSEDGVSADTFVSRDTRLDDDFDQAGDQGDTQTDESVVAEVVAGFPADSPSAPTGTPQPDTSAAHKPEPDTSAAHKPEPATARIPPSPDPETTATPQPEPPSCQETRGMFLPASGVVNALVLFIRYADEDIDNTWWPADGFPEGWQTFIDQSADQGGTNKYNLTNFYREVSRNADIPFTLIGRVDTVTSTLPIPNELDYGQSNKAVLMQVESRYSSELGNQLDQWTRAEHCHNRVSNGDIDLIIMIWRTNRFRNSAINWSGIAHIGGSITGPYTFLGKNVKLPAFNSNFSSGVTVATRERSVRDRLLNADVVFKSTVHEIAHHHITYNHPQGGSDGQQRFPSMLAYTEQEIHSHNGLEADLLGWGRTIRVNRDTTITLGDFFQTGESVWVETSGYRYLIENRQNTSIYDDASVNSEDKGLFVYQFRSERELTLRYDGSNTNIIPIVSDGFYDWEFSGRWLSGWRAIFNRGDENPSGGSGFTRKQPSTGNNHHWISAMVVDGEELANDFRGTGLRAAFNIDRPRLGTDTNPSVSDIELEVIEQSGTGIHFRVTVK